MLNRKTTQKPLLCIAKQHFLTFYADELFFGFGWIRGDFGTPLYIAIKRYYFEYPIKITNFESQ